MHLLKLSLLKQSLTINEDLISKQAQKIRMAQNYDELLIFENQMRKLRAEKIILLTKIKKLESHA